MAANPVSTLPGSDDQAGVPVASERLVSPQALKKSRVMIVDDEPIMMEVVQAFLEDAGYTNFLTTDDSTRALALMIEQRPDVLLLDLFMPGIDGFELLAQIRGEAKLRYLPVIVLTAASDSETKLRALELGATDFLAKPVDPSELSLRLRNALAFKAYQDQLAYYDALTGLPNRQLFLDRLTWTLRLAKRHSKQCALLQIGLDRFKHVNDSFGHQVGDELLAAVSRRLSATLRDSDTISKLEERDESVSLSRLTGDEFMVLISEINHEDEVSAIARRVLDAMQSPLVLGRHELFISISVGIALYPQDGATGVELLTHVGHAMTQAKRLGRNTYAFSSPETNVRAQERLALETALRKAIENDELALYYQPKVAPNTRRIIGAEALLRWNRPGLEPVSPGVFIPLAEETGLILQLGKMVLRQACADAVKWQRAGFDLAVSVNVSGLQFRRGDLHSIIQTVLRESGLPAGNLKIELTESLLMGNASENIDMLHAIKKQGVYLSMDDFGTGYSSLSYLKHFPLDELKIDQSFVRDLPDEKGSAAIVGAVIAMAHGLGLTVTAEGVETPAQERFLNLHGCDEFQGFLFSRAVPMHEFLSMLKLPFAFPTLNNEIGRGDLP